MVHGDDLLYRFFNNLLASQDEPFAAIPQMLLEAMAIWLPPETYARLPLLLPWVVRDPSCRGAPRRGVADEWGSPDARGYLRDDNSLIKNLPRALPITGPSRSGLAGARIGTEFVASHVWRRVNGSSVLASRWPELNSFVPNIVWLPGQIAKLTDREGSAVQDTLQAMSMRIYRDVPVPSRYTDIVERAWSLLPMPQREVERLDLSKLNWFMPTERFYATRELRLRTVVGALAGLDRGQKPVTKVITTRYGEGLAHVDSVARGELRRFLEGLLLERPDADGRDIRSHECDEQGRFDAEEEFSDAAGEGEGESDEGLLRQDAHP